MDNMVIKYNKLFIYIIKFIISVNITSYYKNITNSKYVFIRLKKIVYNLLYSNKMN